MSIQLPEHAWPKALSSTKVPTLCSVWNRSFAGAVGPQHFTLANFKRPFPFNKNRIQTFPLPFPACNVRFNGAFCPSLACGTTLRFGSRPRSRHDSATPWGHVLQLCLGAASKPCKVLKVLVADSFIAHFDIIVVHDYIITLALYDYQCIS